MITTLTLVMFRVLVHVVAVTSGVKVTVCTGISTLNITAGFCRYIYSLQCINLTTLGVGNEFPLQNRFAIVPTEINPCELLYTLLISTISNALEQL